MAKECEIYYEAHHQREDESLSQFNERLINDFQQELKKKIYYFQDLPVRFNENEATLNIKNKHYTVPSCLEHIASEDPHKNHRTFSSRRLKTANLVFAILDKCSPDICDDLFIKPSNKPRRFSVYCKHFKYVIILETRSDFYQFITAYPLNTNKKSKFE